MRTLIDVADFGCGILFGAPFVQIDGAFALESDIDQSPLVIDVDDLAVNDFALDRRSCCSGSLQALQEANLRSHPPEPCVESSARGCRRLRETE